MSDQEWRRAEHEARRDVTAHPDRQAKHKQCYLGGVFYTEQQRHRREAAAGA